jgi:raffinose/stachyose/melibiose transport system permease protein
MNTRDKKYDIAIQLALSLASVLILAPVLFLVLTALKSPQDFYGRSVFALPARIAWNNVPEAFLKGKLYRYMTNGLIISGIKVPLGILIEALAAFALTRLKIKGANAIFTVFLIGMMIPIQITLVPLNIGFRTLGLTNTYAGIILVYLGFGMPFGILVLRGFFRTIPKELDESVLIDGCSSFGLFMHIIVPLSLPAVSTLFILDFLGTWNEFLLVSVLITNDGMRTVPAGLLNFVGENGTNYGLLTSGVLLSLIPVLVVYVVFQRYFVEGMSGAVKG